MKKFLLMSMLIFEMVGFIFAKTEIGRSVTHFYDDFESYESAARVFGDWLTYDGDEQFIYYLECSMNYGLWKNNQPLAFGVLDEVDAGIVGLDVDSWKPHSGSKCIISMAAMLNHSDDWLMSPLINITSEDAFFSFWAKTPYELFGPDYITVKISPTGGNAPEDFTELIFENVCAELNWTKYTIDLGTYYNKSSIRVSIIHNCFDTYALLLDDIELSGDGLGIEYNLDTFIEANNYPNPFNPNTTINYTIPVDAMVNLSIYNIKGEHIKTLVNKEQKASKYSVVWSGRDEKNLQVASGVYFYKINCGKYNQVKKILLMK